jgi:hypothetical protein
MILGTHQRKLLRSGRPKEGELVYREGRWFFNLVVQSPDGEALASGPVMGVDVRENTLVAASTGRIWGGRHCAIGAAGPDVDHRRGTVELEYTLIGDGPKMANIRRVVQDCGIEALVLQRRSPITAVVKALSDAHVLVLSSVP